MARALRAWAINRGGKNSVRNLRYGPRTRLVRGMSTAYRQWNRQIKTELAQVFFSAVQTYLSGSENTQRI